MINTGLIYRIDMHGWYTGVMCAGLVYRSDIQGSYNIGLVYRGDTQGWYTSHHHKLLTLYKLPTGSTFGM